MFHIEAFLASGPRSWWRMPYRFATAAERDTFLAELRRRNHERCFRPA